MAKFEIENGVLTKCTLDPGETEITLPEGIWQVACRVFSDMDGLRKVTIPRNSIVRLFGGLFKSCHALEEVVLSDEITYLDANAFIRCRRLEQVYVTEGAYVHPKAFSECTPELIRQPLPPMSYRDRFIVRDGVLRGFLFPPGATEMSIPEGVTEIGEEAFECCENLKKVTFPSTLRSIHRDAFIESGLEEVVFPEGLTVIGAGAFRECENLKKVTFPSTLRSIHYGAFRESGLEVEEVVFPEGLRWIGAEAFQGTALKRVQLPAGLRSIGARAFIGCSMLQELTIAEGVRRIGAAAFLGCPLRKVRIPDSVTEIDAFVFGEGLEDAELSDRTVAAADAFPPETRLHYRSGELPPMLPYEDMFDIQDGVLYEFCPQPGITDIIIPEHVHSIMLHAFVGILQLSGLLMPDTVKKLCENDVLNGNTAAIELSGCSNLKEVVFAEQTQTFDGFGGEYAFRLGLLLYDENPPLEHLRLSKAETDIYLALKNMAIKELLLPDSDVESCVIDSAPLLETVYVPAGIKALEIYDCPSLKTVISIADLHVIDEDRPADKGEAIIPSTARLLDLRSTPEVWDTLCTQALAKQDEWVQALKKRCEEQRDALLAKFAPVVKEVPESAASAPSPEPEPGAPAVTEPQTLEEHLLHYAKTHSLTSEAYIAENIQQAVRLLLMMDPSVTASVMRSIRIGSAENRRLLISLAQRYSKPEIEKAAQKQK